MQKIITFFLIAFLFLRVVALEDGVLWFSYDPLETDTAKMARLNSKNVCEHKVEPQELQTIVALFNLTWPTNCSSQESTQPFWEVVVPTNLPLFRWFRANRLANPRAVMTCHKDYQMTTGDDRQWVCSVDAALSSWRVNFDINVLGCPNTNNLAGCHFRLALGGSFGWEVVITCVALLVIAALLVAFRLGCSYVYRFVGRCGSVVCRQIQKWWCKAKVSISSTNLFNPLKEETLTA